MDPGVRGHGMKADPPGYLWSKYECFLMSGSWDIPHLRNLHDKLVVNSTNERKGENCFPLGITAGGIITGRISSSNLIPVNTTHPPIVHVCTKFQSSRNKLAWKHHFPIITLWNIFQTLKGHLFRNKCSNLAEIRTCPRFYACLCNLQV